jgi:copper chaperone CopZ
VDTARFTVPALSENRDRLDLANLLISLKGVDTLDFDLSAHTVAVLYDRAFTSETTIREAIRQSGYPVNPNGR